MPLGKALTVKLELETVVLSAELDVDAEIGMLEEEVDHPGLEVVDGSRCVGVVIERDGGTLTIPTEQRTGEKPQPLLPTLHQLEQLDHRLHVTADHVFVRLNQCHAGEEESGMQEGEEYNQFTTKTG